MLCGACYTCCVCGFLNSEANEITLCSMGTDMIFLFTVLILPGLLLSIIIIR